LYEDKGPDIFRKCLNRNLWDSNGHWPLFLTFLSGAIQVLLFFLCALLVCSFSVFSARLSRVLLDQDAYKK
ncbi:MAG: hypothetical protein CMI08_05405, partial [Oceanospirillaceae bacterium]|nr:hypothetical protein [Oceanospirillaceae bacterium]